MTDYNLLTYIRHVQHTFYQNENAVRGYKLCDFAVINVLVKSSILTDIQGGPF